MEDKPNKKTIWVGEKKKKAFKEIIQRISEGKSLRSVIRDAKKGSLPAISTFLGWVGEDENMQKQYARAMEIRSEILFDEILDISDEANADVSIAPDGKIKVNGESVQRSKLRVDARKWALAKMNPKKYGDKVDVTTKGEKIESKPPVWTFVDGKKED